MDNEPKKISFAFSKFSKKSNLLVKQQPVEEKKVEIIEYLEEKSIKVVGGDDKPKGPLIIPMKQPNKKLVNLVDLVKNDFKDTPETNDSKTENGKTDEDQKTVENLTLDEQAARELLNDTHKLKPKEEVKRVIEVVKNEEQVKFEGEKESSIDDYEDIPIEEFGKAMLRGMGWKDGHGVGKNEQLVKTSQPIQRPKGMGLGADKMTKQDKSEKPAVDRDGNALKCIKGAYIKIIAGYHKGNYGQIIGLDDESGRFIIKTALNNLNVSLNEFLVTPVTKEDYMKNSKVINNAKYEEYLKKKELEKEIKLKESKIKKEKNSESNDERRNKKEDKYDKKSKNYRSDSEEDSRRKEKDTKYIKKERRTSESDAEETRSSRKEKYDKDIKKERKFSESEYEEKYSKKEKYEKRTVKKERRSSESDYEDRRNRRDKPGKSSSKYESDEESRDRKNRDKYKQSKSKRYSDDSDSERETEKRKSKKKFSKHNSDSDDHEERSKKKHKKKKSKRHSTDESSEEKYKRKFKKSDKKKYDDSDSEHEEKHKKSQKKDRHRDKRDRSRHEKE